MREERPKVLIADDDPETLNLLIEVLEPDGYRLLVARNGAEAIQLAEVHHPDLLLLDLMMPEGGGYEVCEALRAQEPERDLAVIFLSGLDEPDQIRHGFEVGAVDYITKPFSIGQLRARVRTWLLRLDKEAHDAANDDDHHAPPPRADT